MKKKLIAIYYGVEIVFENMNEASRILSLPTKTIHQYLSSGKEHFTGYRFKFGSRA